MILARCPECSTTFRVLPEQLRDRMSARDLLPIAERHGVSYLPGDVFTAGTELGRDRLRLCFTRYAIADLEEAARRLGAAVREAGASRF